MPQRYEDVLRPDLSDQPQAELPATPAPNHDAWADFDALAEDTDATQGALRTNLGRTTNHDWDSVALHGDPEGPRFVDGQWL